MSAVPTTSGIPLAVVTVNPSSPVVTWLQIRSDKSPNRFVRRSTKATDLILHWCFRAQIWRFKIRNLLCDLVDLRHRLLNIQIKT